MQKAVGDKNVYRVIYVARSSNEVVRRYLRRLGRLRDEGFEVHILAADDGGMEELQAQGFVVCPLPVKNPRNVAGMLGAYLIIQGYFLEHRPVLVHSFSHRLAWAATFAAKQAQVPAIFLTMEYHWLDEDPCRLSLGPLAAWGVPQAVEVAESGVNLAVGPPFRRSMHAAYRWIADKVDRYIVTTEFDFQLMQDMEVVEPKKLEIAIGGAGVDVEEYGAELSGGPDIGEVRRRLGLPNHWRQVVGWVGPVTRRHGAEELIGAIRKLRRTHPSVGWLVVPRGEVSSGQLRRLQALADRGFVQVREEGAFKKDIYDAMDLLAWFGRPSTPHDGIVEAAASGTPTVGYDTPGARSLVEQGETGFLVLESDQERAVAAMAAILDDPRRLEDLGRRARRRGVTRFARRDVDDQILRLYDQVLEETLSPVEHHSSEKSI